MLNIHKIHVKNAGQTTSREIEFIESIESIEDNNKVQRALKNKILNKKFLESAVKDDKTLSLLRFMSNVEMKNLRNFLNLALNGDKITLIKLLKELNKSSGKDSDIGDFAERVMVAHKMMVLKSIFSPERINSAQEAVKNYK